jgi:hypothetical protein
MAWSHAFVRLLCWTLGEDVLSDSTRDRDQGAETGGTGCEGKMVRDVRERGRQEARWHHTHLELLSVDGLTTSAVRPDRWQQGGGGRGAAGVRLGAGGIGGGCHWVVVMVWW